MPDLRYNAFVPQLLLQMQNLLTSNASNPPSSCDEGFADEADEPPDYRSPSYPIRSDEFAKHSVRHPAPSESLLTRALLTTPEFAPTERIYRGNLKRGMSTDSTWSNISSSSTADLTSDGGMTSPSRCNTPSPPPPLFFTGFAGLLQGKKDQIGSRKLEVVGDKDDVVEGLGRRRCITFACSDKLTVQKPMFEGQSAVRPASTEASNSNLTSKRGCVLKFVCGQRGNTEGEVSPPPRPAYGPRRHATVTGQFTQTVPKSTTIVPASVSDRCSDFPDQKFYEFASSVDDRSDSWTNQPIDKSRLLKVDDLLKKELDIRKLSQEAEEEALEEEEAEQDLEDAALDGDDDGDDDEEGDDDQELDEDDYDEEDDQDVLSGNESDNEEGFASDSDDDDDRFFNYGPMPIQMSTQLNRPLCCRNASESSIESMMKPRITPLERRPRTPELPDSTDFVCGTFDEDKALEEAYVSCMEERKRSKHILTPQDIDPSFPTSDPEASDDEVSKSNESEAGFQFKTNWSGSSVEGNRRRGRGNEKILIRGKATSPAPKARVHSPAPIRRTTLAHSPAPVRRIQSPPPPKNRPTMNFQSQPGIYRTKSLPRIPGFLHRNGKSGRMIPTGTSPTITAVSHVIRRRGAIDIVKGLEKKRERRQRLCKGRDGDCRAGQGVEKMRELGLEICGKGKGRTQAQWVLSA